MCGHWAEAQEDLESRGAAGVEKLVGISRGGVVDEVP